MSFLRGLTVLVLVLAASRASATDVLRSSSAVAAESVMSGQPAIPPPAVALPARDPTLANTELRVALDKSGRSTTGPGRAAVKAPEIVLRGRIQMAGQPVKALIEVGGQGLYAITEGARLTVDSGHGESLALQVGRLTLEEVEIEIVGLHQKVTVR